MSSAPSVGALLQSNLHSLTVDNPSLFSTSTRLWHSISLAYASLIAAAFDICLSLTTLRLVSSSCSVTCPTIQYVRMLSSMFIAIALSASAFRGNLYIASASRCCFPTWHTNSKSYAMRRSFHLTRGPVESFGSRSNLRAWWSVLITNCVPSTCDSSVNTDRTTAGHSLFVVSYRRSVSNKDLDQKPFGFITYLLGTVAERIPVGYKNDLLPVYIVYFSGVGPVLACLWASL